MISSYWLHFACAIAALHGYVFYLESLAWLKPRTRKLFRMTLEEARVCRALAFNQGFYNLFLALAIGIGEWTEQRVLVDYAVASVGAAGIILLLSDQKLKRPALVQLIPALIYLVLRLGAIPSIAIALT